MRKLILKISQNSQENTCARVSFLTKLHCCYYCYILVGIIAFDIV